MLCYVATATLLIIAYSTLNTSIVLLSYAKFI